MKHTLSKCLSVILQMFSACQGASQLIWDKKAITRVLLVGERRRSATLSGMYFLR